MATIFFYFNQRFKLFSDGRLFDLQQDPLEQQDLSGSRRPRIADQRRRLQAVLDSLPPDAQLWFQPRSISARKLGIGDAERRSSDAAKAPDDPADRSKK